MRIKDFCTRQVVSIAPLASLREAAQLMRNRHVGSLVDVLRVVAAELDRLARAFNGATMREVVERRALSPR